MILSGTQVARFHDHGYLIAEGVLSDADLRPVIEAVGSFIDERARTLKAAGKIHRLHENEPFERRYALLYEQSSELAHGQDIYESRLPALFDFLRNQHLLDAVECLVGPEITCNPIQHLRAKPPSRLTGGEHTYHMAHVPWHQDAGVALEEAEHTNIVTCWVAITDAMTDNGCLQIMPGANRCGLLDHIRDSDTMINPVVLPDLGTVNAEVRKGGVIFMNKFLPHRSAPNTTDCTMRWSFDLRYQPSGAPTGRPFHPSFVARSRADPGSVLTDHGEWSRQWTAALTAQQSSPALRKHRISNS